MRLGRSFRGVALIAALIAALIVGASCESSDDGVSPQLDATTSPPFEAGLDASTGGAAAFGGAASGAGGIGGSGGSAGTADYDAARPHDSGLDAAGELDASTPAETTHVYVGGYSAEIKHLVLDRATGELEQRDATSAGSAPSYLAIHPQRDALYAINEQSSAAGSQVIAFAIDPEDGALSMINAAPSGGEGSPHLAVHPSGQWIAVAHYGSGHTSVLSVREDRGLNGVVDLERGPADDARKAHQAVFDAPGTTLLVPCLESDYVLQFQFNLGMLTLNTPATVAVAGGPRHLALSPDQRNAYVLSELDSLLTSFAYDGTTGRLSSPQTIDSEADVKGASAHIAVHPSGRWLYVSNRAENSVGVFSIDTDGRPHPVEHVRAGIATPRDFGIDPLGEYLIVANQGGAEDLRVYRIDPDNGTLTFVKATSVGGSPTFVGFVLLPQ